MSLLEKIDPPEEAPIEPGRQLIRAAQEGGASFVERIAWRLQRLSWRGPLQGLRLGGRPALKLIAVPKDPVAGDKARGEALMRGRLVHRGGAIALKTLDFADFSLPRETIDYLHSFEWLRDLAAAATRERAHKLAEALVQRWLAAHAEAVAEPAWRPDLWGRRILFWSAYAPYILSSRDQAYRTLVLKTLARGARHLAGSADRAPAGIRRVTAWAGIVAAGLVVQGGPVRLARGEAGLIRSLGAALGEDGGLASRSPTEQLALVELLSQLRAAYNAARRDVPEPLGEALAGSVSALLGVTLGDEALSSWQGGNPSSRRRVAAALEGSGVRARPLRQARGWGYQRLEAKAAIVLVDAAPPPAARALSGGSASTLAFEMTDGANRLVVNCGGAGAAVDALSKGLTEALRTTAAHSTLTLGDRNSTAILDDGALGRGVGQVELARDETGGVAQVEASHDGYARRYGLIHQRRLTLAGDGRELTGEDALIASGRRRRGEPVPFALRFHLGPSVEVATTADGQGALLRVRGGGVWHFRCRGGRLAIEDSLWIDGEANPLPSLQLVVAGETPADGMVIAWSFRRAS
ncbi:MAG: heparinase II/III family protein [Alphaproteobacteria bacterium]|nr:heparinase II/III family protein [Alphaproteobacteria bacterium]MBV9372225.1 heparinase II/III family protein [Alphaproteobacteria bacterium]MBV9901664.1 heparinase II/III family protein [Alphaproteobacteria bacterium]